MVRVSKFALWYTLGVSFSAKKAPGILLGFLFGLQRASKYALRFSIRHHIRN